MEWMRFLLCASFLTPPFPDRLQAPRSRMTLKLKRKAFGAKTNLFIFNYIPRTLV